MNFKKFNGTTWEPVLHKIYGSGTDSLTAFPAVIQASGEPLTDYTIYGNTVQDGTPSPQNPVDVVGVGELETSGEHAGQYKIPILSANTTTHVYLGEVQTMRKIKKLVLDGTETWYLYSAGVVYQFYTQGKRIGGVALSSAYSTIAPYGMTASNRNGNYGCYTVTSGDEIALQMYGAKDDFPSQTEWKSYLATQYANGTPVIVWYVLAEPETGIVNEPLMKIGDYADTVSYAQAGVTIPTYDGDNTIIFGTSVQPSAMSATFKGWHPVQGAKQYDGSEWR